MRVRDLMNDDYRSWNVGLIRDNFGPIESSKILSIPLSSQRRDRLAWRHSKAGVYSVRTGYVEMRKMEGEAYQEVNANEVRWKRVWDLEVLPKTKVFGWRVLHDILPSKINLISRFIDVDPYCVRCGEEVETSEHALRGCSWARTFWDMSCVDMVRWRSLDGEPLHQWVARLLADFHADERATFMNLLWYLWFARNDLIFQKVYKSQSQVLDSAMRHDAEYKSCNAKRPTPRRSNVGSRWIAPELGWWKLNADAGCRIGIGVGLGGLLRGSGGEPVWCYAEMIDHDIPVNIAEGLAVLRGVRLARMKGVRCIEVETDSQDVFHALSRTQAELSYFGQVVEDIRIELQGFEDARWSWVRRTGNVVAHTLAQFAFLCTAPFVSDSIPDHIVSFVEADFSDD